MLATTTVDGAAPIITKNDTFFIPFTIPDSADSEPKSVELYVSGDLGETWSLYQQRRPDEGRFSFRAGVDGEFWFWVRTLRAGDEPEVPLTHIPELVVIVDREAPKFQLTTNANSGGQITAQWNVIDTNACEDRVTIEFKYSAKSPWQSLSLDGQSRPTEDGFAGDVTWPMPQDAQEVFIRAQAEDKAGNVVALERQVIGDTSAISSAMPLPAPAPRHPGESPVASTPAPQLDSAHNVASRQSIANLGEQTPTSESHGSVTTGDSPSFPVAQTHPPVASYQPPSTKAPALELTPAPELTPAAKPLTIPPGAIRSSSRRFHVDYDVTAHGDEQQIEVWLTDDEARSWEMHTYDPDGVSPVLVEVPHDGLFGIRLVASTSDGSSSHPQPWDPPDMWIAVTTDATKTALPHPSANELASSTANPNSTSIASPFAGPIAGPIAGPVADPVATSTPSMPANAIPGLRETGGDSPVPPMAAPENYNVSRSRHFNLDYIPSTRESILRVEVWFTADHGQSWRHHGNDDDGTSPYFVAVSQDGLYGFRLLEQTVNGLMPSPPQPGEAADAWIRVDTNQPQAAITSAQFDQDGNLQIQWTAQDAELAAKPVGLYFSGQPNGSWKPIALGVANTGSFAWSPTSEVPNRFYLRLDVRDRAGNVATYSTRDPLQRPYAPSTRIQAIRPASFFHGPGGIRR